jgi:hypothetical protein
MLHVCVDNTFLPSGRLIVMGCRLHIFHRCSLHYKNWGCSRVCNCVRHFNEHVCIMLLLGCNCCRDSTSTVCCGVRSRTIWRDDSIVVLAFVCKYWRCYV